MFGNTKVENSYLNNRRCEYHLRYSFKHGERPQWQKSGEQNSNARLTENQVQEIRELLKECHPQQKIADRFGVTQPTIWRIAHGITWIR